MHTTIAAESLRKTHRKLLTIIDMTEDEWTILFFEIGYQHAALFSGLFTGQTKRQVEQALLHAPAPEGEPHNLYWTWLKYKYLKNDEVFLNNLTLYSYHEWKLDFIFDPLLEEELLNMLNDHKIL